MRLIKYTHSCVRLEKDDTAIVIDPGSFSEDEPLDEAAAVLITHEHVDHLDVSKLAKRPELPIWTNAAVAAALGEVAGDRVHVVADGDGFSVGSFSVTVHGSLHEVIHPDLPPVPNIGFFVDSSLFHPGDAFTTLPSAVETLLVPVSAPWLRAADSIEYLRAVRPKQALGAHDGLYNDIGLGVVNGLLARFASSAGVEYARVTPGTALDL